MAMNLIGKITPDLIGKVFETLPSGTRNTLGQYGSPQQWSDKLNDQILRGKLPPNLATADPSLQIEFLVSAVVSGGAVPPDGPHDPAGAAGRFSKMLNAHMNPPKKLNSVKGIESLIAEGDAQRANDPHFLKTRPLGE